MHTHMVKFNQRSVEDALTSLKMGWVPGACSLLRLRFRVSPGGTLRPPFLRDPGRGQWDASGGMRRP